MLNGEDAPMCLQRSNRMSAHITTRQGRAQQASELVSWTCLEVFKAVTDFLSSRELVANVELLDVGR
jgi:hypothetical protein